jgi:hypothetical protein
MNARHLWLGVALVGTLLAAFWPSTEQGEVEPASPAERPSASLRIQQPARSEEVTASPEQNAASDRMQAAVADLFPRQTWVPPPPPPKPQIPPPPPPPKPPPLPFAYLGRWVENNKESVFLVQGDKTLAVQAGMTLPGSWRVDEISQARVVFTYLPLEMQSTLGIRP